MAIRGIGDGYAFQRLLWLLVGLVIAPTVFLALYGASAIRNQNAWIAQQVHQQQELRLRDAARELYGHIGELDQRVHERARMCQADSAVSCLPEADGVAAVWVWSSDVAPPDRLVAVGVPAAEGTDTVWFNPSDGGDPIGVFRSGTHRAAWQLDVSSMRAMLDRFLSSRFDDGMVVELTNSAPGPVPALESFLGSGPVPEVDLLLDRPLNAWRLTAAYPAGTTAEAVVGRTSWVSIAALILLVGLVLLGAVLTLGSAAREIQLSRLQTDFVSSVSHELRTPLTSIRMFVETLQSGRLKDPDRVEECLELLNLETERLSRMIERVLGWARMEAGRRVYEFEDVSAQELVDDALLALRSQRLMAAELEILVEIPDGLPTLRVDRDAIVEALLNLLQNAVKYTPAPRNIHVEAASRPGQVGLAVVDNGPGIEKQDRKRIFEKFYQADNLLSSATQKGAERGSGLGLSIVRAVVRGHGGRVELDSEPGRGSRFTLWLPTAATR